MKKKKRQISQLGKSFKFFWDRSLKGVGHEISGRKERTKKEEKYKMCKKRIDKRERREKRKNTKKSI